MNEEKIIERVFKLLKTHPFKVVIAESIDDVLIPLENFIKLWEDNSLTPSDGIIECVFVDHQVTNIYINGWNQSRTNIDRYCMDIYQLKEIDGEVIISWSILNE